MILDIIIILVLALVGIGLLILEIFFIPGIGIAGIGGIAMLAGAVWFAYEQIGTITGNVTLITSLIVLILSIYWFIKGKMINNLSLHKDIDSTAPNNIKSDIKIGQEGITISQIKPMGQILIDGNVIEAKSENGFIEVNKKVEVEKIYSTYVIISEIK